MPKILVLYYSMYGHVETMAAAIAEGARSVEGADVTVKRVPETMTPDVAKRNGAKLDQAAPVATPAELTDYDAIIFGTPTRFGNMAAQMQLLDQTGGPGPRADWSARWAGLLQHRHGRRQREHHHELRQHPHASRHGHVGCRMPARNQPMSRGEGWSPWAATTPVRMDQPTCAGNGRRPASAGMYSTKNIRGRRESTTHRAPEHPMNAKHDEILTMTSWRRT